MSTKQQRVKRTKDSEGDGAKRRRGKARKSAKAANKGANKTTFKYL